MDVNKRKDGKISIMIVEDQQIILHALTCLINSSGEFEVIGSATEGQGLLKKLEVIKPDIILLDIKMQTMGGIEVTRVVNEKMPWIKVISLSAYNHSFFIKEMIKNGAKGFLSKNCTVQELFEGIHSVYNGKTYFCSLCSNVVVHNFSDTQDDGSMQFYPLTPREIEIIRHLSNGFSTKEIANKLFISDKTVERHKTNLLKKMQLRNTAQLVKAAVENGLLVN
jgi:DNA-binding NarL/FixJ family response regulator